MARACTIIIFTALLMFSACAEPQEKFPVSMLGTWITDTVRYENRYIEIQPEQITIGNNAITPQIFFIKKVTSKKLSNTVEYTLTCEIISGDEFELSFIFHPDKHEPWLQLKNNPEVHWHQKTTEQ